MPRRPFVALLAVLVIQLGVVVVNTAGAQTRIEENVNIAVTGDITALDADARTITVKSTRDEEGVTYQVDDSATILRGAEEIPLSDLQVGWNVAMNGHRAGDARRVTMIKVVKAP